MYLCEPRLEDNIVRVSFSTSRNNSNNKGGLEQTLEKFIHTCSYLTSIKYMYVQLKLHTNCAIKNNQYYCSTNQHNGHPYQKRQIFNPTQFQTESPNFMHTNISEFTVAMKVLSKTLCLHDVQHVHVHL